jgi:hypothetical protein
MVTLTRNIPEQFEREYGCTETEWRRWMPGATGGLPLHAPAAAALQVAVGEGTLTLSWTVLVPRVIALVRLPRMEVRFAFEGVSADERATFMRHFDLHLQRGGG